MGGILSTPSRSNPNSSSSSDPIAPSAPSQSTNPDQEMEPKSPDSENPINPPQDHTPADINENSSEKEEGKTVLVEKVPEHSIQEVIGEEDVEGAGEDEERECGFCLFMKAGGCKETFVEWEKCVEEGEKNEENIVGKCFQATANLKKCMEANADYYGPLLQAEKDAEDEVARQLEEEKQAAGDGSGNTGESLDNSEGTQAS